MRSPTTHVRKPLATPRARRALAVWIAAALSACGEAAAPGPRAPAGPAPSGTPVVARVQETPPPAAPAAADGARAAAARVEDARNARDVAVASLLASHGDPSTVMRSIDLLESALEKTPDDLRLRVELADAYVATGVEGMIALALDLYEEADAEAPDDGVRGRIVDAWERLGNADGATTAATRRLAAATTATQRAAAALQAAWVGVASRRPAVLADVVRPHAAAHPDEPGLAFVVAVLEDAAGRADAARDTLDAVVRATPADDDVGRAARAMRERLGR